MTKKNIMLANDTPTRSSARQRESKKQQDKLQIVEKDKLQIVDNVSLVNAIVDSLDNSSQDNYKMLKIPKKKTPKIASVSQIVPNNNIEADIEQLKRNALNSIENKLVTLSTNDTLINIFKTHFENIIKVEINKLVEEKIAAIIFPSETSAVANLEIDNLKKLINENMNKLSIIQEQNTALILGNEKLKLALKNIESTADSLHKINSRTSVVLTGTSLNISQTMPPFKVLSHLNDNLHAHHSIRIPPPVIQSCNPIFKSCSKIADRIVVQFINQFEKERFFFELNKRKNPDWRGPRPLMAPVGTLFVGEYLSPIQARYQFELRRLGRCYKLRTHSVSSQNGTSAFKLEPHSPTVFINSDDDLEALKVSLAHNSPHNSHEAPP